MDHMQLFDYSCPDERCRHVINLYHVKRFHYDGQRGAYTLIFGWFHKVKLDLKDSIRLYEGWLKRNPSLIAGYVACHDNQAEQRGPMGFHRVVRRAPVAS
jgi:hypothetical protein